MSFMNQIKSGWQIFTHDTTNQVNPPYDMAFIIIQNENQLYCWCLFLLGKSLNYNMQ